MSTQYIDSPLLMKLLRGGIDNLNKHVDEINELNVFPIPDGDTGYNMLLTMEGGLRAVPDNNEEIGAFSRRVSDGMLLAARGNSGVILSQFADGIAAGLDGIKTANADETANAFLSGVKHAYDAVAEPVEGTMLTVIREASQLAAEKPHENIEAYFPTSSRRREKRSAIHRKCLMF